MNSYLKGNKYFWTNLSIFILGFAFSPLFRNINHGLLQWWKNVIRMVQIFPSTSARENMIYNLKLIQVIKRLLYLSIRNSYCMFILPGTCKKDAEIVLSVRISNFLLRKTIWRPLSCIKSTSRFHLFNIEDININKYPMKS